MKKLRIWLKKLKKERGGNRMNREERKEFLQKKVGKRCVICNREQKSIHYHQIFGKNHENLLRCSAEVFEKIDFSNFVPLCGFHHATIHQIFRTKKVNVDNLVILIRLLARGQKQDKNSGYTLFDDGGF